MNSKYAETKNGGLYAKDVCESNALIDYAGFRQLHAARSLVKMRSVYWENATMASPPVLEDSNQMARRAKTRIGVAVVLLAIAIGGLALLTRQKPEVPTEEPPAQKQESISAGDHTVASAPAQITSAQQEPPPPIETAPPVPPPPPSVGALPPVPASTSSSAPATKSSVTIAPEKPEPAKPLEKPVVSAPTATKTAHPAPAAVKTTPLPAIPSTPIKAEPTPRNYDVQVGVFTDMENAKQLQAKLAEHGIPSHTETKLQLGPFTTKAEADAAKEKLKVLGIGAVVVPGK
jgi:DedD protein